MMRLLVEFHVQGEMFREYNQEEKKGGNPKETSEASGERQN